MKKLIVITLMCVLVCGTFKLLAATPPVVKQYYYIDESGNYCNTGTSNPAHQAKIEKHLAEKTEKYKYGLLTGEKIKIKGKKRILVDKKIVEVDQDYLILLEPLELDDKDDVE